MSATSRNGSYSIKVVTGPNEDNYQTIRRSLPYTTLSPIVLEFSFGSMAWIKDIEFEISNGIAVARIKRDEPAGGWLFYGASGDYANLNVSPLNLYGATFHTIKLVADLTTRKYIRLTIDNIIHDLSTLDIYPGFLPPPQLYLTVAVTIHSTGFAAANLNVDDVIVTQSEPPNL